MNNFSEYNFKMIDGKQLYAREWKSTSNEQGLVCLVHGLGEHTGRYNNVANKLNSSGLHLIGMDMRGHGKSPGKRGHIPDYAVLMEDISVFIKNAKHLHPNLPIFLYGHSMGGNLVINYGLRKKPDINGIIATAPWLKLVNPPAKTMIAFLKLMNYLLPSFSLPNNIDSKKLSHDSQVIKDYQNDKFVHSKISARLFDCLYEAGFWALENANNFPLPLLIMHGTADQITSHSASQLFIKNAPAYCNCKEWEGLYHEIHNEKQSEEVLAYLINWLKKIPTL